MKTCCGGKRRAIKQPEVTTPTREQAVRQKSYHAEYVTFVYTGQTSLTAVGPYSRRRYRFPQQGAQLEVDRRDAPSLAAVPGLKRVTRK